MSMTVSFYISWTPYAIVCILSMLGISSPRLGNILSILFAKTGTVINPILYIYFNKEVRINCTKTVPSLSIGNILLEQDSHKTIFLCIIIYVPLISRCFIHRKRERILTFLVKQLWWEILKHWITVKNQSDTTI